MKKLSDAPVGDGKRCIFKKLLDVYKIYGVSILKMYAEYDICIFQTPIVENGIFAGRQNTGAESKV